MTVLIPLLEKYRVTAPFFGHDHNYQHYLKSGIHYVTTAGGGAPLYDVSKPPEEITQKVASIENFVSVSVDGKVVHFQAISIDGTNIGRILNSCSIVLYFGAEELARSSPIVWTANLSQLS